MPNISGGTTNAPHYASYPSTLYLRSLVYGATMFGGYYVPSAASASEAVESTAFSPEFSAQDVDYGSDVSTYETLDMSLKERETPRNVAECIVRRLVTPRGKMSFHPDEGTDIRSYLSASLTDAMLGRIKHEVEVECLQDERVEDIDCQLTFNQSDMTLTLVLEVLLSEGPFEFVLTVDQLTAKLISVEEA